MKKRFGEFLPVACVHRYGYSGGAGRAAILLTVHSAASAAFIAQAGNCDEIRRKEEEEEEENDE